MRSRDAVESCPLHSQEHIVSVQAGTSNEVPDFGAGVLKLFEQGPGVRMKWQAVICGCLVSPPPNPGGGGRSVNTRGRIEDPGGPYPARGP